MVLGGAALLRQVGVEAGGTRTTAGIPRRIRLVMEVGLAWVVAAVVDLCTEELLVAMCAPELLQTSEHLPEDVLPRDLLLPQEHHELVDVPVLVALMFGDRVSMVVYE